MALLSGNFPIGDGFTSANFKQVNRTKRTQTASGRTIRETNATTLWSVKVATPPLTQRVARSIQGFIARCRGGVNEFNIVLPEISYTVETQYKNEVVTVDGSYSAGVTAVDVTTGSPVANDGIIRAGDVIKFSNHTKVYMVTEDVITNASGEATVNFEPALMEDVTSSHTIVHDAVPFRMILDLDTQEYVYTTDGYTAFEIEMREVY